MNGKREGQEMRSSLGATAVNGDPNDERGTKRVPSAAVPEKPRRRSFSPEYKVRIVEEAEACAQPGEIGALLRREGLYSSHLTDWRGEYRSGAIERMARRHRGPQRPDPLVRRNEELEQMVLRLQQRLLQAEKIIEVQKKISDLLGIAMTEESR